MSRVSVIDGVAVVSTAELCKRLGLHVNVPTLVGLQIEPFADTHNGTFWREEDVPMIALRLAEMLMNRSYELASEAVRGRLS